MKNMDLNTKEQAFTEILQDMQFDVDTERLWGEIESSIPVAKKKKKMFWFLAIGLILITTSSSYFFLNQNTVEQVSLIRHENQVTNSIAISQNIKEPVEIESKIIRNNELTAEINNSSHQVAKKETISNVIMNNNNYSKSTIAEHKSIEQIGHQNSFSANTNTSLAINSFGQNNISFPIVNKEEQVEQESIEIYKRLTLNFIIPLTIIKTKLVLNDHNTITDFPKFKNIEIIKSKLWNSFIVFSSGINLNNSNYLINSDIESDDDLFDLEKGKLGMSSNFLYGKKNRTGWEWNIGLGHQMIVSQYNNHTKTINKETVETIVESYINGNGDIISKNGKVDKSIVKEYDIRWHRQHQLFDIKGGIGKEVIRFRNFGFKINTGLAYTIYSQHKGYYFENNKSDITKINNNKHPYRTSGLIKYYAGIGMEYNWNRYAFGMNANYTSDLNSITKNTNYYSLKNSQYGIQFSILYRPY